MTLANALSLLLVSDLDLIVDSDDSLRPLIPSVIHVLFLKISPH
jgi:hypothetical protein